MATIGISAGSFSEGLRATFDALGRALDVSFERRALGQGDAIDGWIILGAERPVVADVGQITQPCYIVLANTELVPLGPSPRVTFTNHRELTAVLRGRDISADDAVDAMGLPGWLGDVAPLATKEGAPVWAIHERKDGPHHYVGLVPPELSNGEPLFTHFSGQRLARLLPLVEFVRSVREEQGWEPPPLQAAFMFDDPNLHWTSYGFVDYGEMVGKAAAGRYHVAFATIPLDSWFVHPPASAIFKQSPDRLSLLYHGNDHVSKELARSGSSEMRRLLRQALGRIGSMEARTGLEVAPVMAPPHGACSESTIGEMARLGFEAVCVSRGSLRHHNGSAAWTRTIGMNPCDVVAGLPVIPRFGLSTACRNDVRTAALLRQPIVPMTHHQALADGYHLLDETGFFVNSLGDVAWRDLQSIARSLYARRQDGDVLSVRMLTNRVTVRAPPGATRIHVARPARANAEEDLLLWRTVAGDRQWKRLSPRVIALAYDAPPSANSPTTSAAPRAHGRGPSVHRAGAGHVVNNRRLYDARFFSQQADGLTLSARRVVPFLASLFEPKAVLDVGCGLGGWCAEFKAAGVPIVHGVDGPWVDRTKLRTDAASFVEFDFSTAAMPFQPPLPQPRYDIVTSFEFFEHVVPERASALVEWVTRLSDVVVMGAAVPGQGGQNHVNEAWPIYWAELFASHGFSPYDCVRPALWAAADVEPWYVQNTIAYFKHNPSAAIVERTERLALEQLRRPPSLVHPELLRRAVAGQPGVVARLMDSVRRRIGALL